MRAWIELPGVTRGKALSAWTDPDLLKRWWGGELEAEVAPGGHYVVRFTGLGQTMRGRVLAYEPEARLAFTWVWEHEPEMPRREVDIRVIDIGNGSRVDLEHGRYGDTEGEQAEAADSQAGWEHFLPRLASSLAGSP